MSAKCTSVPAVGKAEIKKRTEEYINNILNISQGKHRLSSPFFIHRSLFFFPGEKPK